MADDPRVNSAGASTEAGVGRDEEACRDHPGVATELRALAYIALDRLEPAVQRLRSGPPTMAAASCASCPICTLLAVLRGERPELAVQLADQVAGLLAVLRAALDEGDPAAAHPAAEPPAEAAPPGRRVQHIRIERTGR